MTGAQKNERRNDDVPHGRKSVEPDIFGFLISAGKPQCARHQNETRDCHGEARLYNVHSNEKHGRHNNARDVINDQVKDMAINMGSVKADVEFAGNRAVNTIENLTHNEPQKGSADIAVNDRLKCDEAGQSTTSGEDMNAEPSPTLGLGGLCIGHPVSLRRTPPTLDLWVHAGHKSSGAGFLSQLLMEDYAQP